MIMLYDARCNLNDPERYFPNKIIPYGAEVRDDRYPCTDQRHYPHMDDVIKMGYTYEHNAGRQDVQKNEEERPTYEELMAICEELKLIATHLDRENGLLKDAVGIKAMAHSVLQKDDSALWTALYGNLQDINPDPIGEMSIREHAFHKMSGRSEEKPHGLFVHFDATQAAEQIPAEYKEIRYTTRPESLNDEIHKLRKEVRDVNLRIQAIESGMKMITQFILSSKCNAATKNNDYWRNK